jgi:hypothetical protein
MKIETVLNAMMYARDRARNRVHKIHNKRTRQFWRFRKWLVVRDCRQQQIIANQRTEIDVLNKKIDYYFDLAAGEDN